MGPFCVLVPERTHVGELYLGSTKRLFVGEQSPTTSIIPEFVMREVGKPNNALSNFPCANTSAARRVTNKLLAAFSVCAAYPL